MNPLSKLGFLFVLLSAFLLSFKGILIKLLYAQGLTLMDVMVWRFGLSLPLFWLGYYIHSKKRKNSSPKNVHLMYLTVLAGLLGYYLAPYFDFWALQLIQVNIERVVLFIYPAFVLWLHALITRERPSNKIISAFVMTQFGLIVLMLGNGKGFELHSWNEILGMLLALISALFFAFYILINQKVVAKLSSVEFTTWAMTASFVATAIHGFFFHHGLKIQLSFMAYVYLGLLSIFCTFLPLVLFTEGVKRCGGAQASLVSSVGPLFTILFAYFLLGEVLTVVQLAGCLLIILGVGLLKLKRSNK